MEANAIEPGTKVFDAIVGRLMGRYRQALATAVRYVRSNPKGREEFEKYIRQILRGKYFLDVLDHGRYVRSGTIRAVVDSQECFASLVSAVASALLERVPVDVTHVCAPSNTAATLVLAATDYLTTHRIILKDDVEDVTGLLEKVRAAVRDPAFFGRLNYERFHLSQTASICITDMDDFMWEVAEKVVAHYHH